MKAAPILFHAASRLFRRRSRKAEPTTNGLKVLCPFVSHFYEKRDCEFIRNPLISGADE